MWLARNVKRMKAHPGPILLEGGEEFGAPFLIEALGERERLAWLELTPTTANDYVAINNHFADAVNRALGSTLLPHALPFPYGLEVLKKRLPLLGPLTIACTNADYNPVFRDSLLELGEAGAKIVLSISGSVMTFPEGLHLTQAVLALQPNEAVEIAGPYLSESERSLLWRSSSGAYVPFMSSICRLTREPLPNIPSPQGDLTPQGEARLVSPETLLDVLLNLGRYTEALELAVMSLPDRAAEFIEEAGQAYLERGLLARLHLLLESLDEPYQQGEKMLEWRLMAAYAQNDYLYLLPIIEKFLDENEAPELRARYVGTLANQEQRLMHAQRAAAAAATPFTLYQLGRSHPDDHEGNKILRQSVKLAEQKGRPSDITRNAGALADSLVYLGRFQEAASWSNWALQQFDQANLKDGNSRLRLLDTYALSSILCNRLEGIRTLLEEVTDALELAEQGTAISFRLTLAHLELIEGNLTKAASLSKTNFELSPRWNLGRFAAPLVRVLLEQGYPTEAISVAQHAETLSAGEEAYFSLPASLALGMAYTLSRPEEARGRLLSVLQEPTLEASLRITAALYLLKLNAVKLSEFDSEMQEILLALTPAAFRLFCGPEDEFSEVWEELTDQHAKLRISVLGHIDVQLEGEPLELGGRALEVLVLLALHPQGLTAEALHVKLYTDEDTKLVALRSAVSRLRTLVPISAYPQPYKITVPFEFDVQACEAALSSGRVRQALELYRGALLELSEAPGIRETRDALEERLRQSVLQTGDPSLLMVLAETLKDDLEVWQLLHATLPTSDTRLPTVKAQLQRVTRELHPHFN